MAPGPPGGAWPPPPSAPSILLPPSILFTSSYHLADANSLRGGGPLGSLERESFIYILNRCFAALKRKPAWFGLVWLDCDSGSKANEALQARVTHVLREPCRAAIIGAEV